MPQVQNSRSDMWVRPYRWTYKRFGGSNPATNYPETDFALLPHYWGIPQTQVINSFRTGGWKTDSGESTAYEDLTGVQLRSEVNLEGQGNRYGYDTGHEFWTTRKRLKYWPDLVLWATTKTDPIHQRMWAGPVLPTADQAILYAPVPGLSTSNYVNLLGSRAFRELAPGKSPVNLLVSLAELYREGLPLYDNLRSNYQESWREKTGSAHLETQFGLRPLVGDMKGLASLSIRASDLITQYHRDVGKSIRRRAVLDESTVTSSGEAYAGNLVFGQVKAGLGTPLTEVVGPENRANTVRYVDRTYRRTWFSGAFSYYLDGFGLAVAKKAADAETLLGLNITPEVFWELTPWSWLFDWFSNFGNLIAALSRVYKDSLILRYGYLMVHQRTTREMVLQKPLLDMDGNVSTPFWITLSERKERVRANPYGFGVDLSGLTNLQWSILAALGLTKAPKAIR